MKRQLFKHFDQTAFLQKFYFTPCMHRYIIPRRCLLRIAAIPCAADITVSACKQNKHIAIFRESLVMVRSPGDVPANKKSIVLLFDQYRDLCRFNSAAVVTSGQSDKGMHSHKFDHLFLVWFFIMRVVVHSCRAV